MKNSIIAAGLCIINVTLFWADNKNPVAFCVVILFAALAGYYAGKESKSDKTESR